MIKVGDTVAPILETFRKGVVLGFYEVKHKTMMLGGPMSAVRVAKVRMHESGQVEDIRVGDLTKIENE